MVFLHHTFKGDHFVTFVFIVQLKVELEKSFFTSDSDHHVEHKLSKQKSSQFNLHGLRIIERKDT